MILSSLIPLNITNMLKTSTVESVATLSSELKLLHPLAYVTEALAGSIECDKITGILPSPPISSPPVCLLNCNSILMASCPDQKHWNHPFLLLSNPTSDPSITLSVLLSKAIPFNLFDISTRAIPVFSHLGYWKDWSPLPRTVTYNLFSQHRNQSEHINIYKRGQRSVSSLGHGVEAEMNYKATSVKFWVMGIVCILTGGGGFIGM